MYKNEAALFAHLTNGPVLEALGSMPNFLDGGLDVTVYGAVSDDAKEFVATMGIPCEWHQTTAVGFYRDL